METLLNILPYAQIITGILLVAGILMQQTDASLGAVFGGGDDGGGVQHTRRGFELTLFHATIVLAVLFGVFSLISFFI